MNVSYRDLRVWQGSMKDETSCGVHSKQCGEGKGRLTDPDRVRFFSQSRGSLLELETQILIAERLQYLSSEKSRELLCSSAEVGRMLNALIQSIRPVRRVVGNQAPHSEAD